MTNASLQVSDQQVIQALARLQGAAFDIEPVMRSIGERLTQRVKEGFHDLKSPAGINWAQLSQTTLDKRRKGSGNETDVPLQDSGQLFASMTFRANHDLVEIGSNKPYAAMMNFGGTKAQFPHLWGDIPARAFLPDVAHFPAEWTQDILTIIDHHFFSH